MNWPEPKGMKFTEVLGLGLVVRDGGIYVFDIVPQVGKLEDVPEGLDEAALRTFIQVEAAKLGFVATPDEFYDWYYYIELAPPPEVVPERSFVSMLKQAGRNFWLSLWPWGRLVG